MIFRRRRGVRRLAGKGSSSFHFLPDLGKATPMRRGGGVVRSHETNPNAYLSSRLGNAILGDGEGISHAIPDVLATESQMRQLIGDHRAGAAQHGKMVQWRGILATLLLWNTWNVDERRFSPPLWRSFRAQDSTPFATSVLKAVGSEWPALRVLYLQRMAASGRRYEFPLAFASARTIIVPAENPIVWYDEYPNGLRPLLPEEVRWYDTKVRRFTDPCDTLSEPDRIRLSRLLTLLMGMHEQGADKRLLRYDTVSGALQRFVDDLDRKRQAHFNALCATPDGEAGREQQAKAWQDLHWRVRAAFSGLPGIAQTSVRLLDAAHLTGNYLLSALLAGFDEVKDALAMDYLSYMEKWMDGGRPQAEMTIYSYHDVPFAVEDSRFLLCPYRWAGESEAEKETLAALRMALDAFGGTGRATFTQELKKRMAEGAPRSEFISKAGEWLREDETEEEWE